ncbi:MAG: hypothetical protein QOC93_2732, partial [Actinomycetota bacterium]|nr:hypothetical protein [Actinomycetota bacterium]
MRPLPEVAVAHDTEPCAERDAGNELAAGIGQRAVGRAALEAMPRRREELDDLHPVHGHPGKG